MTLEEALPGVDQLRDPGGGLVLDKERGVPPIGKALIAEAIGTFALSFVGVLAISAAGVVGAPAGLVNLASIGLAHGLTIAVMIAALGAISGGHFNPAVTFGFVVTGRMRPITGLLYWVAQLVGATIAGLLRRSRPACGATTWCTGSGR